MNTIINGRVTCRIKMVIRFRPFIWWFKQLALVNLLLLLTLAPAKASISPSTTPTTSSALTSSINPYMTSNETLAHWVNSTLTTYYPQQSLNYPNYLAKLYQQIEFKNFWFDSAGQLNTAARLLLSDIKPWLALDAHPKLLPYQQLADLLQQPVNTNLPRHRQATDLLITDLFLSYQNDLLQGYWATFDIDQDHGITNAYERWDNWPDEVVRQRLDEVFPRWLQELNSQQPAIWAVNRIQETQPISRYYLPWRKAFSQLEALADLGDWPKIESYLTEGSRHAEVTRLAVQLLHQGDLHDLNNYLPQGIQQPVFDEQLTLALKSFQQRHQLQVTGETNELTRRWLNMLPEERLRLLAHNIRRLHHLPKQLNSRHIMINMADQRLTFIEDNQLKLDMKIVIGRDGLRTPIMNQWLTSIVLNPLWNVPNSIAKDRIFPRALKNPEYLSSRDYALVDGWHTPSRFVSINQVPIDAFESEKSSYRIVQKTGSYNQLGKAKFRLSNQQAIYLHDTPYRQVFNDQNRDLSAGCVRLEDADQLVLAVLKGDKKWTEERVIETYQQGEERYVKIHPKVAVYLMYWSVWTDNAGRLQWREDIYQKDTLEDNKRLALRPLTIPVTQ
ncbi:MAG: L,D-transpeptidase family protein [Pseudomonadaceae bacterium]|nr:L,D-transpeptidase family protein [Pseudomonadaceae bacterium]